ADAHHDLGLVLYGRGQLEDAIREFPLALEIGNGNDAEAHRNLGRALYESGDLAQARKEFEMAIAQREGGAGKVEGEKSKRRRGAGATEILGSVSDETSQAPGDTVMIAASPRPTVSLSASHPSFPEAHLDLGRVLYD